MLIERFVLSPFQQNTRIVACEATRKAMCIDPGERSGELVNFIRDNELELQAIALTHGHLDHVGGTGALAKEFPQAEILLHSEDEPLYYALPQQALFMGVQPDQLATLGFDYDDPPELSRSWEHGEVYRVGKLRLSVLHCPGHTPGHVILTEQSEKKVFVGDCLFEGSIGRTDLPGGSYEDLMRSIRENIMSLGDEFIVCSGHGRDTTVGRERTSNPFLTGVYDLSNGRYI